MRSTDHPEIRALPLFADMEFENFERLMWSGYVQNFPPKIDLIEEGEPADFLHILVSGSVELFAGWNGRETSMSILEPISTFILAATILDAPYLMSARTIEKSRVILLASEEVRAVFAEDGAFARAVVSELAASYRAVVKTTKDLKLRTSMERLANYLLRAYETAGAPAEFELAIEKRQLAALLGMTPENLSRAIRALAPYGVAFEGARVCIADPTYLSGVAKPTPLIDDPNY